RNNRAESHLFELAPIQNCGEQRSTLAEEGDIAGPRRILGEGGVQADRRIHHPQTVGTDQAHGAATELFLNLALKFDALRSSLLESRRDHDCGFQYCIDAFADNLWNRGRGCGYDRQVNLLRNPTNARVCLAPTNFRVTRVYGIHLSVKRRMHQVLEDGSSYRAGTLSGSNHGHRVRLKQCVETG